MKKEILITMLIEKGWFYYENFFDQKFCLELLEEVNNIEWNQAQIGKNTNKQVATNIRTDSIAWIEEDSAPPAVKDYLSLMNNLMDIINQELYLGLKKYECHFAKYKTSGFYKKHLDQHSGSDVRVISSILYLNEVQKGGELVIYNRENPEITDVLINPRPGSFVCFLSNQIYHEVLPTDSERFSLTGWFRNSIN